LNLNGLNFAFSFVKKRIKDKTMSTSSDSLQVLKEFNEKLSGSERHVVMVNDFDSLALQCALWEAEKWYKYYVAFKNLKDLINAIPNDENV
jgi:hypothetical protein